MEMRHLILALLIQCTLIVSGKKLRIIHTNDLHARFDQTSQLSGKCTNPEYGCYGGFPRLLTAVKAEQARADAEGVPWIFLNAGDTYQGTLWYSVFKWPIVADLIDRLGLDAMSLGNHEFDDGIEGLSPFLKNITTPVLACNLDLSAEPDMQTAGLKPSLIIERGGLRIGVIGYITPESKVLSNPGNLVFLDEISSITAEVEKLKASNVSIIIALGHSGYDVDQVIAAQVPDLDIVVGGHSHSFLYTGTPPDNDVPVGPYPTLIRQQSGRLVPVVQAYAFTKYLGVFDIEFDEDSEVISATGTPILLNSSIVEDPAILEVLAKWQVGIDNATQQHVAQTYVFLEGSCRFNECNLGNIIADGMYEYGVESSIASNWTQSAIALYSGGGVRASIETPNGTITREDVMITMPFFNPMSLVAIDGKYLLEALEWSVARYDVNQVVGRGEFLQVSGIHVEYDLSRPVGTRVVSAYARCALCRYPSYSAIDPDASYNIVLNTFIANGGDNFTMISDNKRVLQNYESLDTEVVIKYMQRRQIIYDGTEERIKFVNSARDSRQNSSASRVMNSAIPTTILISIITFLGLIS